MLATIGGGCVLFQAEALGRPTTARLDILRTLQVLDTYQRSRALIRLDGRRYRTTCFDHWGGRHRRADVVLDGRLRLPEVGGHLVHRGLFDSTAFLLAGCPRPLVRRLSSQLAAGASVELRRADTDGVRTWAVRLPQSHPPLELFVSVRTGTPVELVLQARRMRGTSEVTYGRRL
jgi:hypothetical protein